MATKDFKRKLSAILSADMAGYSRLMSEDEAATVPTQETYRGGNGLAYQAAELIFAM